MKYINSIVIDILVMYVYTIKLQMGKVQRLKVVPTRTFLLFFSYRTLSLLPRDFPALDSKTIL